KKPPVPASSSTSESSGFRSSKIVSNACMWDGLLVDGWHDRYGDMPVAGNRSSKSESISNQVCCSVRVECWSLSTTIRLSIPQHDDRSPPPPPPRRGTGVSSSERRLIVLAERVDGNETNGAKA